MHRIQTAFAVGFLACILFLGTANLLRAQTILSLDFNDRAHIGTAYTEPGFQEFVIGAEDSEEGIQTNATTRKFGQITVTVEDLRKLGYDDRCRSQPTNESSFTESLLLRDCILAKGVDTNSGLKVTIQGLAPDREYKISIWSYDAASRGTRVSDWFANEKLVKDDYTLIAASAPTSNDDYRFDFNATATSAGEIVIIGRRQKNSVGEEGKPQPGVFLNALRISAIP